MMCVESGARQCAVPCRAKMPPDKRCGQNSSAFAMYKGTQGFLAAVFWGVCGRSSRAYIASFGAVPTRFLRSFAVPNRHLLLRVALYGLLLSNSIVVTPLSCAASCVLNVDHVCPRQFISGGRRSRTYSPRPARGKQEEGDTVFTGVIPSPLD